MKNFDHVNSVVRINTTYSEHLEDHVYYLEHFSVVYLDCNLDLSVASNVLGDFEEKKAISKMWEVFLQLCECYIIIVINQ